MIIKFFFTLNHLVLFISCEKIILIISSNLVTKASCLKNVILHRLRSNHLVTICLFATLYKDKK
jgi:hypothetical protein